MRVFITLIILYGVFAGCTPESDGTSTETDTKSDASTTPDTATSSDADTTTIDGVACVEGAALGYRCKADSDCARPLLCLPSVGECRPPYTCTNDESCVDGPNRICVNNFCVLRECTEDSDCLAVCRTTCNEGACE